MAQWFASLTWSQASLVAIGLGWAAIMGMLILWAIAAALGFHGRPLAPRRNRRIAHPQRRRSDLAASDEATRRDPWPVEDYDSKRREKVQWLGDRHLLARPVRRLGVPSDSIGKVIQFDRGRK